MHKEDLLLVFGGILVVVIGVLMSVSPKPKPIPQPQWSVYSDSIATCYKHVDSNGIVCIAKPGKAQAVK